MVYIWWKLLQEFPLQQWAAMSTCCKTGYQKGGRLQYIIYLLLIVEAQLIEIWVEFQFHVFWAVLKTWSHCMSYEAILSKGGILI